MSNKLSKFRPKILDGFSLGLASVPHGMVA